MVDGGVSIAVRSVLSGQAGAHPADRVLQEARANCRQSRVPSTKFRRPRRSIGSSITRANDVNPSNFKGIINMSGSNQLHDRSAVQSKPRCSHRHGSG